MLTALLITIGGSCAACLLITPVVHALAVRCRLLDRPDGRRKLHARATPVAGGLAIFIAATTAVTLAFLVANPLKDKLVAEGWGLLGLLFASIVICGVGVADDFGRLRGRHKLAGQILAIAVLISFGAVVRRLQVFGMVIELEWLAIPFTGLWLLGAINSLNLLDGMDGLLTSVGLIMSIAVAAMSVLTGQWPAACVAAALAGALLGFLRYNLPPASIFLGDNGSMLIGLAVGALAIRGAVKGPATVLLAAPAALLAIPFFDTAAAIARRKLTGRSIYTTDRGHLHHCLLGHGMSIWRVLLLVSFGCLVTAAGALASLCWQSEVHAVLAVAAVIGILVVTRLFGHAEMVLVRLSLVAITVSLLRGRRKGVVNQIEVRLQGSTDWKEVWGELTASACRLNLIMVRFNVNAPALQEGYHARWDCPGTEGEEANLWRAEIPLSAGGQIVALLEIRGRQDDQPVSTKMIDMANLVEHFENAVSHLVSSSGGSRQVEGIFAKKKHESIILGDDPHVILQSHT